MASKISVFFHILCILFSFQGAVYICKSSVFVRMYLPFFHSITVRVFGQSPPAQISKPDCISQYQRVQNRMMRCKRSCTDLFICKFRIISKCPWVQGEPDRKPCQKYPGPYPSALYLQTPAPRSHGSRAGVRNTSVPPLKPTGCQNTKDCPRSPKFPGTHGQNARV